MYNNSAGIFFCALLYLFRLCRSEIFAIKFESEFFYEPFEDAEATFGPRLSDGVVRGILVDAFPESGCTSVKPPPNYENDTKKWILIVPRYTEVANCSFEQKVRMAQDAGYKALIVHNVGSEQLIPMYAANKTGIHIPSVFVSEDSGLTLRASYANPRYYLVITSESPFNIKTHLLIPFAIVIGVCFLVISVFMIVKCIKERRRQGRHRLPTSSLNKIPLRKYQKGDPYEVCAICLDDFVENDELRVLPCNHGYHSNCIDPWLTKNRRVCPICKRKVFVGNDNANSSSDDDSDSDSDDTAPLINASNRGTQGGTFVQQNENPIQRAQRSISQQSNVTHALVTASDHHSINGDCSSSESSSSTTEFLDSLEIQINSRLATSLSNHNPTV